MSWLTSFLGDVLWGLGSRAVEHSRRLSPRRQKEEMAAWAKPHMLPSGSNTCLICGNSGVTYDPQIMCPGTPAQQKMREEMAKGDYEIHK